MVFSLITRASEIATMEESLLEKVVVIYKERLVVMMSDMIYTSLSVKGESERLWCFEIVGLGSAQLELEDSAGEDNGCSASRKNGQGSVESAVAGATRQRQVNRLDGFWIFGRVKDESPEH